MCPVPLCPSPQQLSDYVLGKLNEAESDSVADHLIVCDSCQSRVDESADSMVHKLRRPTPDDEFMNEPQCELVVADARGLARELDVDRTGLLSY